MGNDGFCIGSVEIIYRRSMIGQRRKNQEFKLGALVPKAAALERLEAFFLR